MAKYLLFDIGGTAIKKAVYIDGEMQLFETATDAKKGAKQLVDKIIDLISCESNYSAIGISTAGQVDNINGSIIYANENMPGYTGTRLKEILESHFHVPVYVENDVNAAALGEGYKGIAQNEDNYLCLTYGTGVGGAIVINKEVYRGATGSAGEFGAMLLNIDKHIKGNAYSGGYEKIGSTTALVNKVMEYRTDLDSGRKILSNIHDEVIANIVDCWCKDIALGLTSLIHIFNPSMVILGGGIMEQDYIFENVVKHVKQEIMPSFSNVQIKRAKLGNKAGLYGALSLIEKENR